MNPEWSEIKIEEIAKSIAMGPFGSDIKTDNFVPEGVPVIRGGNLSDGGFQDEGFVFLTEEKADQLRTANAFPNDLIFTHRGTLGQISIIPVNAKFPRYVVSQSQMRLTCDTSKVDPSFLYYFFRSSEGQHKLLVNTSQTGVPAISRPVTSLKAIKLNLPPLPEQKAIVRILSSLDDKIELNRRMNAILETLAQTLFRAWFVDFEPVKTKAAGLPPVAMDAETATLFPSEFVDSELGPIPKGWNIQKIEDVSERVAMGPFGSSIKVSTFVSEGVPVISGQHLRGLLLHDSDFNFVSEEHAQQLLRSNVQRGDVVFTHAGSIGQVVYIPETSRYSRYIISQRQFYMRCNREQMSPLFVALYFKTPGGQHRLLANTSSTGVPSISQPVSYLRQLKILVPPREVLNMFDQVVGTSCLTIARNIQQSHTLAQMREELLPRLISGQTRLPDSEFFK